MALTEKTLALFFSKGISLKDWEDIGQADRELKFYNELAQRFNKVYFFTYGTKQDLEFQQRLDGNLRVFPKKWRIPRLLYYFFLPFLYRKELKQCDILKTNQMSAAVPALLTKWLYGKKLVLRCGYEWLNVLEKEKKALWKRLVVACLERLAYSAADKIVFTSQKDKGFAQKRFKVSQEKIELVPNYIDIELFKPSLGIEKSGILYVGRLSKEKNLLNLVKAVGALQQPQQARLTLIGKGSLDRDLKKLASQVRADVEFKGRVANEALPQELNKCRVFVLLSLYEGCPKALLEAMACGLACVGSNVEGINEVIQHKENGYLTGTDSESIKKALEEVLSDAHLQQRLGQRARETIIQRFGLEKILDQEIKLYNLLLS